MIAATDTRSIEVLEHSRRFIPGGVNSLNRAVEPALTFARAEGAYLWDVSGKRYVDYHAAFAPHFLGHNHPLVNDAVIEAIQSCASLYGAGATTLEAELAELISTHVEAVDKLVILNTGSEADSAAVRVARAVTGREHVICMQGGYNGQCDDLACNVMTPLERIGPRVSPGEYPFVPLGAGMPARLQETTHVVNFNDLASVRWVCERHPVAVLVTEPLLQNIGVVAPQPGYLQGLRELADEFGFLLVFDEVKTGFRHALGGYSQVSGVRPDLVVYGKAVANGYPLAILGGKAEFMDLLAHPDAARRPFVAGTYNGHPVPVAAAIATIRLLLDGEVYTRVEELGQRLQLGIEAILQRKGIAGVVARQGSAFALYFMDHLPVDWHDLASHHDFARDRELRLALIERGIYFFPLPTKQCSISAAHTAADIDETLEAIEACL